MQLAPWRMDEDIDFNGRDLRTGLTRGEIECLRLVRKHFSSKEIAARLSISPHTVDQRIRSALRRLGVRRRGEAARLLDDGGCPADVRGGGRRATPSFERPSRKLAWGLPFATRGRPRNALTMIERLFWIALIAIGSLLLAGLLLAALESAGRLVKS